MSKLNSKNYMYHELDKARMSIMDAQNTIFSLCPSSVKDYLSKEDFNIDELLALSTKNNSSLICILTKIMEIHDIIVKVEENIGKDEQ